MKKIFDELSLEVSRCTTKKYSTSFSLGISFLKKDLHDPIYAIYGFVRFADEIVDSFHAFDKAVLLRRFRSETFDAIRDGISLNPVLNSFQWCVNKFAIDRELIGTFLDSMAMDLDRTAYDLPKYEQYILGSAEVVGLMCLKVFVRGDETAYRRLRKPAMKLGSAFQKINFLRDLKADYEELGRTYFPGIDLREFNGMTKSEIEKDIEADFRAGYEGIKQLPKDARFGVYMAYVYYYKLFKKIRRTPSGTILTERVRLPNNKKYRLFLSSYIRHNFNLL